MVYCFCYDQLPILIQQIIIIMTLTWVRKQDIILAHQKIVT